MCWLVLLGFCVVILHRRRKPAFFFVLSEVGFLFGVWEGGRGGGKGNKMDLVAAGTRMNCDTPTGVYFILVFFVFIPVQDFIRIENDSMPTSTYLHIDTFLLLLACY